MSSSGLFSSINENDRPNKRHCSEGRSISDTLPIFLLFFNSLRFFRVYLTWVFFSFPPSVSALYSSGTKRVSRGSVFVRPSITQLIDHFSNRISFVERQETQTRFFRNNGYHGPANPCVIVQCAPSNYFCEQDLHGGGGPCA